jgi:hypothetical protein
MEDTDWTGVIFGMGVLTLGTIILVVVLVVGERFYRARLGSREVDRVNKLVERYEETATSLARSQESAAGDLADLRERVTAIERILREVE